MAIFLSGLLIFLGLHSLRIVADPWRQARIAQWGLRPWRAGYSLVALLGLVLIIVGYGQARAAGTPLLWTPPAAMAHLSAVLVLIAFVLLVAAKLPGNLFKARLGHPQLLGVKTWAFAHLLANGSLLDVLLFGSFLVWAVLCFRAARQRDRATPPPSLPVSTAATAATVLLGAVLWALFAFWLHGLLIGVKPLG